MTAAVPGRTIAAILELPFAQQAPHACLGIDGARDTVDLDFAGFGWTVVDRIWLSDASGAAVSRTNGDAADARSSATPSRQRQMMSGLRPNSCTNLR